MPAALATKNPFCHLPGQATCSITLHKNLAKGPKHTLRQFKIQNILKNSSKKQVSLNWWTLQSNKTSNYASETLNGSWGYWQNTLTSVCTHPALGSIDIEWNHNQGAWEILFALHYNSQNPPRWSLSFLNKCHEHEIHLVQSWSKSRLTPTTTQRKAWHMDSLESENRSVKLKDSTWNLQLSNFQVRVVSPRSQAASGSNSSVQST